MAWHTWQMCTRLSLERLVPVWNRAMEQWMATAEMQAPKRRSAAVPPLDSKNLFPWLIGEAEMSPRRSLQISERTLLWENGPSALWKLLVGDVPFACRTGPDYPNTTGSSHCAVLKF